jgi:hypothetical protein
MSVFSQFTAGTPTQPAWTRAFNSSTTFVPSQSGWYQFLVVGAGGGGGASATATQNLGNLYTLGAIGGGAGGCAIKTAFIASGASIVITLGAGGNGGSVNSAGTAANGNSGSITTVVGGGVSITCNAGSGGSGTVSAVNLNSSVGGNATGGDENWTGGGSQSATISTYSFVARGGGSVGFFGTGYTAAGVQGAGTGGDGRQGSRTRAGDGYSVAQYGGGGGGNFPVGNLQAWSGAPVILGLAHNGFGQTPVNPSNVAALVYAGVGAGGAYVAGSEANSRSQAGLFGGGGACLNSGNTPSSFGGTAGRGGGGGGASTLAYSSGGAGGGPGGGGFVMVGFLGS